MEDGHMRRRSSSIAPGTTSSLVVQTFQMRAEAVHMKDRSQSSRGSDQRRPPDLLQSLLSSAPGCYPGDDGSADIADRYNFFAHGKRFLFAPCSLGIFPESNRFRQAMIWCITWKRFDQFILLLIAANSIILSLADYSTVNEHGDLDSSRSVRNAIVNYADSVFTTLFSIECTMKIIAMGMFGEKGAYLMDPWNCMDFVVVFVGILAVIPGIPNVSVLRTFRVLRPLRSLNAVAGMKKLVSSLLKSIPELLTVVAFLSFLFFLYGVVGVQLWSGVLHPRCRLTPHPVMLDPALTFAGFPDYQSRVLSNASMFACSDRNGTPIPVEADEWSQATSPWKIPRICYWPVAVEVEAQTCALDGTSYRPCPSGQTCGSDFDTFGNFRFTHPDKIILRNVINGATYNANMGWGYVSFDHIGFAALAIFQCITREGWSDIMYMLQDAGYGVVSVFYFVSFIIIGSYFMLNLTLAVIWENFSEASLQEAEEKKGKQGKRQVLMRSNPSKSLNPRRVSAFRSFVGKVIEHWLFNSTRTVLILLNTIILSLDQYPANPKTVEVVELINFGLTVAFLFECMLKMIGLGFSEWTRDGFNWFDAIVVILGIIENVLSPPDFWPGEQEERSKAASFSGFRSVRLFALFKLARSWPSLHKLLATMVSTIKEVGNFSVLFLLFMYIYALIGMQTFANQFRFDDYGHPVSANEAAAYIPRSNFDTMLWSMVTVFQILTGENWNVVMQDGWRSSGWSAVLYFLSLVVFGNFIVLNLFLAILLGNFEETSDDEKREEREREELKRKARVAPTNGTSARSEREGLGSLWRSEREAAILSGVLSERSENERVVVVHHPPVGMSRSRRESNAAKVFGDPTFRNRLTPAPAKKMTGRSLMVFSMHNPLRKLTIKIISHPQFDNISLALILISTVSLAIDNPLNPPDSVMVAVLSWVDYVLTILFMVEVVVKIIALGFLLDQNAYLRNSWNVMDFVITTLAGFSLGEGRGRFKFVKTLRTFRALRPLRMINRNPGLKLVVSSLIASIPQILNVIMVCFLVFTIFSIVAVNNLKGKLYSCQGDIFDALSSAQQDLITYPRLWTNMTSNERDWFNSSSILLYSNITDQDALTSRIVCGLLGAAWQNTIPQDFDNVLHGIQTFFEMTTTEGWVTIMLASVDTTEIDMQPIVNNREGWTFFFVAFILVGTFFVMQLFVGVVIENFNRMKEKLDGTYLLSTAQREWLIINEAMLNLRPARKMKTPQGRFRRTMFRLARSATFEVVMVGCIMLNTVIMALHYFGEEDLYRKSIETSNYVFATIFSIEAAIKITGLGGYYWKDSWNVFDFVVVVGTFLGMLYQWIMGSSVGTVATTIRSVRVGRLFRLIQSAPSLRQLFNTLLITLPSLVNIGGLLFLVFFIYAAMGVQLFAKVKIGEMVTATTNFQTISRAMITLVRCATGERWNDLMYELASQDNCTADPEFNPNMCGFSDDPDCMPLDGCGSPVAFAYLYSFTLLVSFILLNIFIAVILEGFANEKDRADGILLPHHYENFVTTWSLFDPQATGFIDWYILPSFIEALDPPMGFDKACKPSAKEVDGVIEMLDLPIFRGNKVFFNDVARRMGKFVVDEMVDEPLKPLPASLNLEQRWRKYLVGRKVRRQDHTMHRLNQFQAAVVIHSAVKALILREDLKEKVRKLTTRVQMYDQSRTPSPAPTPIDIPQPIEEGDDRESSATDSFDDLVSIAEGMLNVSDSHPEAALFVEIVARELQGINTPEPAQAAWRLPGQAGGRTLVFRDAEDQSRSPRGDGVLGASAGYAATMPVDLREARLGSTGSLFRSNTMQSIDALKVDDPRPIQRASSFTNTKFRLRAISRVTWGSVFRGIRAPNDQGSALDEFQQKLHLNSDMVVAVLELAIILLSCVQLEESSRSPRWRENKVCARLPNCVGMENEGSFAVPNGIRTTIGLLGVIRLWIRIRFLLKQRHVTFEGISWLKRTANCRIYFWELLGIAIFPYPGLENLLDRNQADLMIFLSIAVGVRSICWRHIMYFPYPIREKSKVTSFAGNLEFSYREFVFKKVMDDHPIRKIVLVSVILLIFATFLVRAIETINCVCTPFAEFAGRDLIDAHHLNCVSMSWGDAFWLVSTSFVMLGFGDVVPRSKAGRSVIVVSACVMRVLAAMLASVVIKKSNFSTMEARVHAFLFRMDLFNKKDLSAVMAVQASFRFAKSYRRSLKWHKHQNSLLYYRPLSARLPNEVKKKLYVSRFQASLKEIMKFNTDGDPMNAFAKHIEVITAALGITLVEMAQLKKVYWRKSRLLDEKQKIATEQTMALLLAPSSPPESPVPSPRQSGIHFRISFAQDPSKTPTPPPPNVVAPLVPPEWGESMVSRCEKVLAELCHIEQSAKSFREQDRSNLFPRRPSVVASVTKE